MSGVIWGIVNFDKKYVSEKLGQLMMKQMEKYKIDCYKHIHNKNIFIGCGIQYITEESLRESLPFYDKESRLILTADAIIDNREELLEKFQLGNKVEDFTDSEYILMAYKKWGEDCPKYLVGDFTFAILDCEKERLFTARDHVGKRTFYYFYDQKRLIFSTLIKPIMEIIENKELNEKWIAQYLAIPGVLSSTEIEETMYKDIFQLPPFTCMSIDSNKINTRKYWNPEKDIKTLKLSSDKEYETVLKKVFVEAVKCRVRCRKGVGIMISSGLDSSSVGAVAAKCLKEENKVLNSFTSIPINENNNLKIRGRNINERKGVELLVEKSHNIYPKYCELKELNPLTSFEENCEILEMPFKAIENLFWYIGLAKEAAKSECKVLLDGQFGNSTISYGEYYTNLLTLIKHGRLFKTIKEIKGVKEKYKLTLKASIQSTLKLIVPYKIRKLRFSMINNAFDKYEFTPANKNLIKKWNIDKLLENNKLEMFPNPYYDWRTVRKLIVNPVQLAHIAEFEVKISLMTGLIKRDPTRDKRLIEVILSFPSEQFVRNGEERYLIKRVMTGLVPEEILNNKLLRGIQAADWVERLRKSWGGIYIKLVNMINDPISKYYFDEIKIRKYIEKFKILPCNYNENDKYELRTLLSAYIFYAHICKYYKEGT
ncbi:MAG: hypothetical protein K0R54_4326 [Clostridiaceae bacterium]|nr:hypothetical protein [Clostridiaceae bacterium]